MKTVALPLLLGLTSLFLLHCAEGSTFERDPGVGGEDEVTSSGIGSGSSSSGNTAGGAGGKPGSSSGSGGAEGGSGGGSASSSSSGASSSSSSGGGNCDPTNPGGVCAGTEHCLPKADGKPICQGPVGSGTSYFPCTTNGQCAAAYACINTGGAACCLTWCTNDFDCPGFETCNWLAPKVFVGSTEYGVCSDFLGC